MKHSFPGSFIPSVQAIVDSLARQSEVRAQGYPESFVRMWEYYLCYCEGGFEERQLGDVQMLLTKPRSRRASIAVVNAAPA